VLSGLRHRETRLQGLGQEAIEELTLSDPRTGQTYDDDAAQVARNSSVVVKRTPGLKPNALQAASGVTVSAAPAAAASAPKPAEDQAAGQAAAPQANGATGDAAFGDLYSEQAVPEAVPAAEDEMQALLQQANDSWRQEMADSARASYGRGPGGRFGGRGDAGRFGSGGRGEHTTSSLHARR
jgi:DWNN domain